MNTDPLVCRAWLCLNGSKRVARYHGHTEAELIAFWRRLASVPGMKIGREGARPMP